MKQNQQTPAKLDIRNITTLPSSQESFIQLVFHAIVSATVQPPSPLAAGSPSVQQDH